MTPLELTTHTVEKLKVLRDKLGVTDEELIQTLLSRYDAPAGVAHSDAALGAAALADAQQDGDSFFRTIIEQSTDIIAIYDRELRHIYINPAVHKLAGLEKSAFLGKTDRELGAHRPDELQEWEAALRSVITTGQPQLIEMGAMHFERELYFETSMMPQFNAQGEIVSVITISRDVTLRRKIKTNLEEREAHYRQLFMGSNAIQLIIEPSSGHIIDANPAACNFYGYSHADITKLSIWEINTIEEEKTRATLRRMFIANERTFVFNHRLASGEIRTVRTHLAIIQVGEGNILHAIITDITGAIEAENALIRSEKRFRGLAEHSPDTVYIYNIKTATVEYINNTAMFGHPINDVINPAFDATLIYPDDRETIIQAWENFIHDNRRGNHVTTHIYRLQSTSLERWRWVQNRMVVLEYDDDDYPQKVIVTLTDITPLKNSELSALESEARYMTLISAMAEGIVVQLASGEIITYNRAAEQILGLTYEQMMGRTSMDPRWQAIREDGSPFPGDEHPATLTLKTGQPCSKVIMGIRNASDALTWISINTQPLFLKDQDKPYAVVATFTDITELTNRQQELRILTRVVEQSPNSIVVTDLQGTITYVNPHFTRLTGYTAEEVIGQNPRIQQSGFTDRYIYEDMWRVILSGKEWRGELLNKKKNGDLYWEDIIIAPIKNHHDEITHFAAVKSDITAQRHAAEALRVSEERFRTLVGSMDDIVFMLDTEHRHTGAFGRWLQNHGLTEDYFIGKTSEDLMSPEQARPHIEANKRALKGEQVIYEWETSSEGKTFYYQTRLSPIINDEGEVTGLVGVGRDITSLREAESAIRTSEHRYRSLFENTNDAVFIISLDEHHLMVNQRAAEIMGKPVEDIVGKPSFQFIPPDQLDDARLRMRQVREGVKIPIYERTFRRPDGTSFIGEVNIALVRDKEGNPLHVQSIIRDISDRKEAERRMLEVALEKERGRVFSRFIETFSHEFRTPLSIISTRLYLLDRQTEPEDRQRHIEVIQNQIVAITGLVDAMVMMTRLEHKIHPPKMALDLNQMFQSLIGQIDKMAMESEISFEQDISDDLPVIMADAVGLTDAIKRVINNAIRYSNEGGTVRVEVRVLDENVQIKIIDQGIGIPQEMINNIFEAFYRVDNARSTSGFGLGLAIARRVFEYHNGTITVESEIDKGSTFIMTLPIVRPE